MSYLPTGNIGMRYDMPLREAPAKPGCAAGSGCCSACGNHRQPVAGLAGLGDLGRQTAFMGVVIAAAGIWLLTRR